MVNINIGITTIHIKQINVSTPGRATGFFTRVKKLGPSVSSPATGCCSSVINSVQLKGGDYQEAAMGARQVDHHSHESEIETRNNTWSIEIPEHAGRF